MKKLLVVLMALGMSLGVWGEAAGQVEEHRVSVRYEGIAEPLTFSLPESWCVHVSEDMVLTIKGGPKFRAMRFKEFASFVYEGSPGSDLRECKRG